MKSDQEKPTNNPYLMKTNCRSSPSYPSHWHLAKHGWPKKNPKNKSRDSYFWKYLWYVSIQLLLKSVSKYSSRCSVHQRNVYFERVKQKIYDIWKILPTSRRLALNMSFNCLINHQDVCRRPQKAKSQMRFRIR